MTHDRGASDGAPALAEVMADLADHGLTLVRSQPRGDRLHVEVTDGDGRHLRGQWLLDPAVATEVADATTAAVPRSPDLVRRHGRHLVLQAGGADARLRPLAGIVAGGADLVVHRPERRAVVRGAEGYTKVVRPRRAVELADRMRSAAAIPEVHAPEVLDVDEDSGTIRLSTLPGRTLHDLLADAPPDGGHLGTVALAVGHAVRALHDASPPTGLPGHDVAAEAASSTTLLRLARRHRALPEATLARLSGDISRASGSLAAVGAPHRPALIHRDLHDKQLLVETGSDGAIEVGILDVDMLALGDPALDLGNVLAHLDLRVQQGWTTRAAADVVAEGILEGYAPDERVRAALPGYRALTCARLVALYAFRPGDLEIPAW